MNENKMMNVPQKTVTIPTTEYAALLSNSTRYHMLRDYLEKVLSSETKFVSNDVLAMITGIEEEY